MQILRPQSRSTDSDTLRVRASNLFLPALQGILMPMMFENLCYRLHSFSVVVSGLGGTLDMESLGKWQKQGRL